MKKLTEIELKNKTIDYLNKKGMAFVLEGDAVIWYYTLHYSKFKIKLNFEKKNWNDEVVNVIKYYTSNTVKGLGRRKTGITDGYLMKVYKTVLWLKEPLDKIAEAEKIKVEMKTRYCTELESYYKKLYRTVHISTDKQENLVNIGINCYSDKSSVYYNMTYKDNKYYLNNRIENLDSPKIFKVE